MVLTVFVVAFDFEQDHAHFNFGPLYAYLSINYLDIFLVIYEFTVSLLLTIYFIMVYSLILSYLINKKTKLG